MKPFTEASFHTQRFLVRLALTLLLSAISVFFLACSRSDQTYAGQPEKVTIACSTAIDTVLAAVAQTQGFYRQEGLEVTSHEHPYGKPALGEVLEGKADFATVAETPVMFEIMKGEKISVIATIQTSSMDNAIVARKDKGIRTGRDLKGKKLGVPLGTTADFFMDYYLATHGLSRKEIRIVDLKAEELPESLAKGGVDAASLFNPYIIEAQKKLGERGISFFDADVYTWTFNIVATQDFIRNNPEKVRRLLKALLKAEEFTREQPETAQKIVADSSRVDMDLVRAIWADTSFRVVLDQSLVLALEDESRWAIKEGLTGKTKIPNYLNYIYFDGLRSVKPDVVRILR